MAASQLEIWSGLSTNGRIRYINITDILIRYNVAGNSFYIGIFSTTFGKVKKIKLEYIV